jgi:hypothetical protein
MTGWLGVVFSGLFLAAVRVIWRASDRSRPMTRPLIALGVLIAPALVWASLIDGSLNGRFGDMHLSLSRLTADITRGSLSIGGGPDDDLFIRGASPSVVTIPRQTPGAGPVLMEAPATPTPNPVGETLSVAAVKHGGVYDYIGARDFGPGMAVCLKGCEAADAVWYRFERGPWRFEGEGQTGPALPQRRAFGLAPTVSWKPSQAIHPLNRVLPGAPRTHGFVYQTGKLFGGWKILLLDPNARLGKVEGGQVVQIPAPKPQLIPVSEAGALSIWDVRTYNAVDPGDPLGRLQERREIALAQTGTVVTAALSTPAVERVGRCPRNGSPSPVAPDFPVLGGDLSNALTQDLPYPEPGHCAELVSGTFHLTDPVAVGKSAELRLDRLGGPWILGWLALAWAVVVIAVWGDDWRSDEAGGRRLQWMLFVALQALMAMRMLTAFAGLTADPELAGGLSVVGEAGLAYVAMTGLFLLLAPPSEQRMTRLALVFGFMLAVSLALHLWMTALPGSVFTAPFQRAFWTPTPGGLALLATAAVLALSGVQAWGATEAGRRVADPETAFTRRSCCFRAVPKSRRRLARNASDDRNRAPSARPDVDQGAVAGARFRGQRPLYARPDPRFLRPDGRRGEIDGTAQASPRHRLLRLAGAAFRRPAGRGEGQWLCAGRHPRSGHGGLGRVGAAASGDRAGRRGWRPWPGPRP